MLVPIPVLSDNYVWLYQRENSPALLVDMGDFPAVFAYLQAHRVEVEALLLTHNHQDHIAGVMAFRQQFPHIPVFGSAECGDVITKMVTEQGIRTPHYQIDVLATPGHTEQDLSYLVDGILFCGDTLFSAGCGRVFTGDYAKMFESLQKIKDLPDETQLCPAHEYTLDNIRFAQTKAQGLHEKQILEANYGIAKFLVESGMPTLPTTLRVEKMLNPFIKAKTLQAFTMLRKEKDNF